MATIYEVSKLAGVSLATVSRVINKSGKVRPETRQRVENAMLELGYQPNFIAQSLASNRSNSVGVLVPELHGPFFGNMLSSIEDELRRHGKHVIITAGHSDRQKEKESIGFLASRLLHGFPTIGSLDERIPAPIEHALEGVAQIAIVIRDQNPAHQGLPAGG